MFWLKLLKDKDLIHLMIKVEGEREEDVSSIWDFSILKYVYKYMAMILYFWEF